MTLYGRADMMLLVMSTESQNFGRVRGGSDRYSFRRCRLRCSASSATARSGCSRAVCSLDAWIDLLRVDNDRASSGFYSP